MDPKKVVIIGGGCAGLSAAYNLKQQGIDFVLFEASKYVGGRCRTEYEDGYEFFVGAGSTEPQWETTFQYLKEFGLEDRIYSVGGMRFGFVRNGKIRTVFLGNDWKDNLRALPENISFLFTGIPFNAYLQLRKVISPIKEYLKRIDSKTHNYEALSEISDLSTEEFFLKYGAADASRWFAHTLLAMMVLARPKDISIAHPLTLFSLMQGMCSMHGGLGMINEALYERVKDHVRLNTPVKKVVIKDSQVVGVELEDGFVEADQVICAVDAVLARNLIPDLPESMRKPLETCKYSSTYYYQFGLEKQIVNKHGTPMYLVMIPPDTDSFMSYMSLGHPSKDKPVMVTPTRGWEDEQLAGLSAEERNQKVIAEIRRFVPFFPEKPKVIKCYRWNRAVNIEAPGQHNTIRDMIENHMKDVSGLYLAGEYLFLLACTEGAFNTGKKAAERVVEDLRYERLPA
jgi:protoporphyrinogen/coproporphyrinogen III oxidase